MTANIKCLVRGGKITTDSILKQHFHGKIYCLIELNSFLIKNFTIALALKWWIFYGFAYQQIIVRSARQVHSAMATAQIARCQFIFF